MRTDYAPFPGYRWITSEDAAREEVRWYMGQDIAHWREKRRKTHKLLKAARKEIQRLRDLTKPQQ